MSEDDEENGRCASHELHRLPPTSRGRLLSHHLHGLSSIDAEQLPAQCPGTCRLWTDDPPAPEPISTKRFSFCCPSGAMRRCPSTKSAAERASGVRPSM